jgi:cytosine/adenosine deaminase-related metal-dependent hydrolase
MGPDILLSHCNGVTEKEASIVLSSGAYISSTPSTELQMGLGEPVCFQDDLRKVASIGVDCHSATSASLVAEARLALQYTRGRNNQRALNSGSAMSQTAKTLEAFNLITIKGARAAGLGDMTGSIAIGKRADLVFWDKLSPGMLAAGEHDLVAAIMHHSSVEEVRSVMVDGIFRKQDGRLLPVFLHDETTKKMQWKEVAQEVLRSRKRVEWRISDAQRA